MKRYLLFCFENYYPEGGMNDFVKDFDSVDEAKNYGQDNLHDLTNQDEAYIQVYDLKKQEVLFEEKIEFNEMNKLQKSLDDLIYLGKLSAGVAIRKMQ